jgi:hypothetical protein
MVQQFNQHLEALVAGELFVKIPILFFSGGEVAEFLCRFLHLRIISLAASFSERIC